MKNPFVYYAVYQSGDKYRIVQVLDGRPIFVGYCYNFNVLRGDDAD